MVKELLTPDYPAGGDDFLPVQAALVIVLAALGHLGGVEGAFVTGHPVRSCKVPEVMTVSPTLKPCNTCTSASVRMPVVISTGCAFPAL